MNLRAFMFALVVLIGATSHAAEITVLLVYGVGDKAPSTAFRIQEAMDLEDFANQVLEDSEYLGQSIYDENQFKFVAGLNDTFVFSGSSNPDTVLDSAEALYS